MSGSAYKHTAPVEDLLKGLAYVAAARRAEDERRRAPAVDGRSIVAAAVALFIFVPGCAAATVFLLQTEDAIASPLQPVARSPLKSDRLPLPDRVADSAFGFDPATVARSGSIEAASALHMQSDAGFLGTVIIRGRIEDDLTEAAADSGSLQEAAAAAPEQLLSPPPKHKSRRHAVRTKAPKQLAEHHPDPEPPTILQRLFGLRSL
jgi:hypothetical protein